MLLTNNTKVILIFNNIFFISTIYKNINKLHYILILTAGTLLYYVLYSEYYSLICLNHINRHIQHN